ncbi:hypothetical protein QVD17_39549 [Tagetes erecta]|uniref:Uncharacterized protein n=1 Tax=Tagetes erecta TaxID=13708 RepID=A0AAD8JSI3_TARER|nr:hypothetical protein QVD17_39549 [Tagetes erecta]
MDQQSCSEVLNQNGDDGCASVTNKSCDIRVESLSDEDDVEEVYNEMSEFMVAGAHEAVDKQGASTPSLLVSND